MGRDQVSRLMRICGISGVVRGRYHTVTTERDKAATRHPDLIDRQWSAPARPDPVTSKLPPRAGRAFPGRCACDRYVAARRSTSTSCSSSRLRCRNSRSSASRSSGETEPVSAAFSAARERGEPLRQRHRVNPEVFRDLLDRHPGFAVLRDTHHVVAELLRVGLGHDGILPGPPSRASQIRCHLSVQQTRTCGEHSVRPTSMGT